MQLVILVVSALAVMSRSLRALVVLTQVAFQQPHLDRPIAGLSDASLLVVPRSFTCLPVASHLTTHCFHMLSDSFHKAKIRKDTGNVNKYLQ